ncbi:recQ [Mytilus edulis]|uniref:RecQ n=1 Tax=Mytilus edulis TaxID=6550 RepID=A0A8S3V4D3_MYTED|nr:recQ [Mytilus edulis]
MSSASIDDVSGVLQRMNSVMTTQYSSLKNKQTAAITECQKRNDVLVVLPTGYGKTVIIQANADLVSCAVKLLFYFYLSVLLHENLCLQALPFLTAENACVVIINGLTSIIQEQKTRFGDKAIVIDDEIIKYLEDLPTPNSKNQQLFDIHDWGLGIKLTLTLVNVTPRICPDTLGIDNNCSCKYVLSTVALTVVAMIITD